ncbi:membrane protein [Streptomyces sp. CNQ-509]|uniref:DUF2516 family protein n=1 Tax=unclassified Streptomyces TaxID=2593676 RepID=UPI00062DEA1E|nr:MULTISPECIES: DUF2516 family protein [unclassified Streptomyces]AKH86745.1 membrane protein [Streptomyces sp. CNQ-509]AUH45036.1 DUF2516 domain-containing protein [Streptomyces sp. CMB-StM0423]AZM50777.1 DUF2516 domain-containing protein [Streptomyces sp. WAC 06738]WSA38630.1 DUF2516 family protein [Streptomyces sp. NBC_01808]
MLISGFYSLLGLLSLALTVFAGAALILAALAREDAYRAADKNTKQFWLIILGVGFAVMVIFPIMSFLPIIALIAAIVFMVDVRPALKQVGGGRRRGGSSSDGPYGPFNGR